MSKIIALDLGDQWIGIAISDSDRILARPLTTIMAKELFIYLKRLFLEQEISTIVIGLPKTMRGTESEQTKKIRLQADELKKKFPMVEWLLWDERLTSSRAAQLSKTHTKEEKIKSHARAAAFILDSYLTFLKNQESI